MLKSPFGLYVDTQNYSYGIIESEISDGPPDHYNVWYWPNLPDLDDEVNLLTDNTVEQILAKKEIFA